MSQELASAMAMGRVQEVRRLMQFAIIKLGQNGFPKSDVMEVSILPMLRRLLLTSGGQLGRSAGSTDGLAINLASPVASYHVCKPPVKRIAQDVKHALIAGKLFWLS